MDCKLHWNLDILKQKFYDTDLFNKTKDLYTDVDIKQLLEEIGEIDKKFLDLSYDQFLKSYELFMRYIELLPKASSINGQFRWGITKDFEIEKYSERFEKNRKDLLNCLEYAKKNDFTEMETINFHFVISNIWKLLELERYEDAEVLIDLIVKIFEISLNEDTKGIPFSVFGDDEHILWGWCRRYMSILIAAGTLYYHQNRISKSIECYKKILDLGNDGVHTGIFYYVGINRQLESAVQLYKLQPTEENKKIVYEWFQKRNEIAPPQDTDECVYETLLIDYMIFEDVIGGKLV